MGYYEKPRKKVRLLAPCPVRTAFAVSRASFGSSLVTSGGGPTNYGETSYQKSLSSSIVLRHQEDLSYDDIADVLDIPLGTVKARIHRAREMLTTMVEDKDFW